MASPVSPNPSNFIGVALVVNRSRDGPRFVFHYPPRILPCNKGRGSHDTQSTEDFDDNDDVLANQMMSTPFEMPTTGSLPKANDLQNWNHDDHLVTESGSQIVPWEHVAGYPTKDLESLLTPSRTFHKTIFQVSLDQLVFVSYPICVPESGIWRKKKKPAKYQQPAIKSPENGNSAGEMSQVETKDMESDDPAAAAAAPENPLDEAEEKKSGMNMFNLVFILNPKKHEVKELTETLYFNIIKKMNKPLKYSQQRSDFVWKESKRILALKDRHRELKTNMSVLWKEIIDNSSLAACMQDAYDAISHNKIAALQLDTAEGMITHSVQVPAPFYLTDLPPDDERSSRGLWLTTANYFVEEDALQDPGYLAKNFTLLLMSDEKKIIAELQADAEETTNAMVDFVRLCKPTMSFHQISQGNALSPAQVRRYAQHFIYWRRAIAIPPLHARDVYVTSPNCDAALLPKASQAWSRAFPLAPPLPDFLTELSAAPRPYKWFCPSKSHRPTYLQMLAWLMRGGWVTQLCTFAYVVVWPEILYEVDYELEAEELRAAAVAGAAENTGAKEREGDHDDEEDKEELVNIEDNSSFVPDIASSSFGDKAIDEQEKSDKRTFESLASLVPASAREQHVKEHSSDENDDEKESMHNTQSSTNTTNATSTSHHPSPSSNKPRTTTTATTTQTHAERAEAARLSRLADKEYQKAADRASAFSRKPLPQATDHPSLSWLPNPDSSQPTPTNTTTTIQNMNHLADYTPYIIDDAKTAAGKDSLYLSAIGRRFKDPKVRAAWPVFWKYFNGRSALERVALQQDMKRKETWNLLTAMSEYLICVRHW